MRYVFDHIEKVADGSAVEAFLVDSAVERRVLQLTRPDVWRDAELYGRVVDSSKRLLTAHHPALLSPVEMHSDDDGRVLLLTAPVSGRTAATYLREVGPLSSEDALMWGVSLCEALASMHERGVVHGCLSPSHVYLDGPPDALEVRLFDTGLLLFRGPRSLRVSDDVVLVPATYLSPERVSGQRATTLSDVYGLGVLLFELLTGLPPFAGDNADETKTLHLTSSMPELRAGLSRWAPVLERCMAKDPQARYASALEVRQALLELSAGVEEDGLDELEIVVDDEALF